MGEPHGQSVLWGDVTTRHEGLSACLHLRDNRTHFTSRLTAVLLVATAARRRSRDELGLGRHRARVDAAEPDPGHQPRRHPGGLDAHRARAPPTAPPRPPGPRPSRRSRRPPTTSSATSASSLRSTRSTTSNTAGRCCDAPTRPPVSEISHNEWTVQKRTRTNNPITEHEWDKKVPVPEGPLERQHLHRPDQLRLHSGTFRVARCWVSPRCWNANNTGSHRARARAAVAIIHNSNGTLVLHDVLRVPEAPATRRTVNNYGARAAGLHYGATPYLSDPTLPANTATHGVPQDWSGQGRRPPACPRVVQRVGRRRLLAVEHQPGRACRPRRSERRHQPVQPAHGGLAACSRRPSSTRSRAGLHRVLRGRRRAVARRWQTRPGSSRPRWPVGPSSSSGRSATTTPSPRW